MLDATYAYFSDLKMSIGNAFAVETLDLDMNENNDTNTIKFTILSQLKVLLKGLENVLEKIIISGNIKNNQDAKQQNVLERDKVNENGNSLKWWKNLQWHWKVLIGSMPLILLWIIKIFK